MKLLTLLTLLSACDAPPPAPEAALDLSGWLAAPGVVQTADGEVGASLGVRGVVAEVLVRPGQRVEAGAELLRLDLRAEELALAVAEAELAAAEAALARLEAGPAAQAVLEAEATARAAEQRAKAAALRATNPDAPEAAEAAARAEEASAAAARLEALRVGAAAAQIDEARALRDAAAARRDAAALAVTRGTLLAPLSGTVVEVRVRQGELAEPGPLVVLVDRRHPEVRAWVAAADVAKVGPGQEARVMAGAATWTGAVDRIGVRAVPDPLGLRDAVVEVIVRLEAADALLLDQAVDVWLSPAVPPPATDEVIAAPVAGEADVAPIAAPRVAPPGARLAPVVVEGEGLRPLDELQKPMPKLGESGFRLKPGQKVLLPEFVPTTDGVFGEGPASE